MITKQQVINNISNSALKTVLEEITAQDFEDSIITPTENYIKDYLNDVFIFGEDIEVPEIIKSICLSLATHEVYKRYALKDAPDMIKDAMKAARQDLDKIRKREIVVSNTNHDDDNPEFTVSPRYFTKKLI